MASPRLPGAMSGCCAAASPWPGAAWTRRPGIDANVAPGFSQKSFLLDCMWQREPVAFLEKKAWPRSSMFAAVDLGMDSGTLRLPTQWA